MLKMLTLLTLAILILTKASAQQSDDGRPTRVFRQGEFLPLVAVSRTGGAAGLKQFENVAAPSDAVQRGTPVNLKLLYSNRVLPLVSISIAMASIVSRAAPLLQPGAARALTRQTMTRLTMTRLTMTRLTMARLTWMYLLWMYLLLLYLQRYCPRSSARRPRRAAEPPRQRRTSRRHSAGCSAWRIVASSDRDRMRRSRTKAC